MSAIANIILGVSTSTCEVHFRGWKGFNLEPDAGGKQCASADLFVGLFLRDQQVDSLERHCMCEFSESACFKAA